MTSDEKIQRLQLLSEEYYGCVKCPLMCNPEGRSRINVVFGTGNVDADILVISDSPGRLDDQSGDPFYEGSPQGEMLDRFLKSMNSSREEIWLDHMAMCRGTKVDDHRRDRAPSKDELMACRDRLNEVIRIIDPKVIVLLGSVSLRLAKKWGDWGDKEVVPHKDGITTVARKPDPYRLVVEIPGIMRPIRYVAYATFHPSYLLRLKEAELRRDNSDLEMAWRVWRHAFRMADSFNFIYEGTIPPQRGIDVDI